MASRAQFGSGERFGSGDANLDGAVDVADFEIWSNHRFTATAGWCNGDFNVDGQIDVSDFNIWNDHRIAADMSMASRPDRIARQPRAAEPNPTVGRDSATPSIAQPIQPNRPAAAEFAWARTSLVPATWENQRSGNVDRLLLSRPRPVSGKSAYSIASQARTELPLTRKTHRLGNPSNVSPKNHADMSSMDSSQRNDIIDKVFAGLAGI
jgi:hypothetical protein